MKTRVIAFNLQKWLFVPDKTRIIIKPNYVKWLLDHSKKEYPETLSFTYTNIAGYLFLIFRTPESWISLHKKLPYKYRWFIAPNTGDDNPAIKIDVGYLYNTKSSRNLALKENMKSYSYTASQPVHPEVLSCDILFVPGHFTSQKEKNIQNNLLKLIGINLYS